VLAKAPPVGYREARSPKPELAGRAAGFPEGNESRKRAEREQKESRKRAEREQKESRTRLLLNVPVPVPDLFSRAEERGYSSVIRFRSMEFPDAEVRRALVASYASVITTLELDEPRPIVLPNGEFFPDLFVGDEASVQRLLDRLLEHAGLADMAVTVRFWGEAEADASCGTGACGSCGPSAVPEEPESVERLVDAGDSWQVNVLPGEASQPVALSSALCRAVALAVLREADAPPTHLQLDLAVDLTAVALGYGVLLLEGSHMYRKSCGGPAIGRSTALGPSELALVLALTAAVNEQPTRALNKYLSATQREAFAEAKVWVDSNSVVVQALSRDPERIARGEFELRESASWLGRVLKSKTRRAPSASSAETFEELEAAFESAAPVRALNAPRVHDARFEEIKRLVDEALSE
jgi:hypothetical protein